MSRVEDIKGNQIFLDNTIEKIVNMDLDLTQEQILNLNLSVITKQLADISITLAMIADKEGS